MSETRKIQLTGGSTYTVSLPKQWAREHGLEAGARLHLYPQDNGTIVVRAERLGGTGQETSFSAAGLEPGDIRRTIHALYATGYDSFQVTVPGELDMADRNVVASAVSDLIGLEALSETEATIECECLLNTPDISVRQSVIQLQLVALSMHETAFSALAGDDGAVDRVRQRDDEADRLFALVDRYYQRSLSDLQEVGNLGLTRPDIADYRAVARQLERVADRAETIATLAERIETTPDEETITEVESLAHEARTLVENASNALLGDADASAVYRTLGRHEAFGERVEAVDRSLYDRGGTEAYQLGKVLDSVRRTADYGGNIAEVALQAAVREGRF